MSAATSSLFNTAILRGTRFDYKNGFHNICALSKDGRCICSVVIALVCRVRIQNHLTSHRFRTMSIQSPLPDPVDD